MNAVTERILEQGQALVRAIEAIGDIDSMWALERVTARILLYAYKRRLRGLISAAPAGMAEEILSESQAIDKHRAAVWLSEN